MENTKNLVRKTLSKKEIKINVEKKSQLWWSVIVDSRANRVLKCKKRVQRNKKIKKYE